MYLRWKVRRRLADQPRYNWRHGTYQWQSVYRTAVLVKSVRVDGKPRQQYVASLSSIDDIWLHRPWNAVGNYERFAVQERVHFWKRSRRKLAKLVTAGTVLPDWVDGIEEDLAKMVPLPTEDDLALTDDATREWWARSPEEDEVAARELLAALGINQSPT